MRSKPVAFLLADLGVTKTHSRPNLSDDNRYSKSSSRQKDRMGFGAVPGAILLTDFAREDSGAHLLLGVVIVSHWSYPRSVDGLRLGIQGWHCSGWVRVGHILLS